MVVTIGVVGACLAEFQLHHSVYYRHFHHRRLAILLARFNYEVSAYAQKLKALEQQQASASIGSGSALPIGSPTTHGESHHGSLPRQLSNYLSMVEKLAATPAFLNKRAPKSIQALLEAADWRSEVDWMTALLADPTWAGQTVLAHGDAQENNWMLLPMDQDQDSADVAGSSSASSGGGVKARLFLIDYEYSSRSPAGFDIGNMYCEVGAAAAACCGACVLAEAGVVMLPVVRAS